jgi:nitric oxide reductase large subunit
MAGSAILGFLLTLAITSFFEPDPAVGFVALFAYFALFGVSGTVAIGLVLWLIVDWRSKKRLSRATLEKEATS